MKITYDPVKNQRNIDERQLSFDEAINLDWHTAIITPDLRKDYGEPRYITAALLEGRLHILVFTPIVGGIRVISFRKANKREVNSYEKHYNEL